MTGETPKAAPRTPREGEEHPLSLVLFAPLRSAQTPILWGLVIAAIAVAAAGFFVKPGYYFPLESIPVSYGAIGAAAVAITILLSIPLAKLLGRPEIFYEDSNKTAQQHDEAKAGEATPDA